MPKFFKKKKLRLRTLQKIQIVFPIKQTRVLKKNYLILSKRFYTTVKLFLKKCEKQFKQLIFGVTSQLV